MMIFIVALKPGRWIMCQKSVKYAAMMHDMAKGTTHLCLKKNTIASSYTAK